MLLFECRVGLMIGLSTAGVDKFNFGSQFQFCLLALRGLVPRHPKRWNDRELNRSNARHQ
jgi:hypothetical protein